MTPGGPLIAEEAGAKMIETQFESLIETIEMAAEIATFEGSTMEVQTKLGLIDIRVVLKVRSPTNADKVH
jgi:hypothetical protein